MTSADVEVVAAAIRRYRYHHMNEDGLQAGVAAALEAAQLPVRREVRLTTRDRVDVLSGGIGIEVKIGSASDAVLRQLQRYAHHDHIHGLVLVTTKARHRALPESINGKPLQVVHLGGAA